MVKCAYCGREVALPFKCKYCGKFYCAEHRLPEAHECKWRPLPVELRREMVVAQTPTDTREEEEYYYVRITPRGEMKPLKKGSFLDFVVGVFAVFVAGVSYFPYNMDIVVSVIIGVIFALAYTAHEGAHYLTAKRMSIPATYVLNTTWLLILTITLVLPVKFIFPGTVIVLTQNKKKLAKVSAAGPAANLALSAVSLFLYFVVPVWWLWYLMLFSAMIGLLNMVPAAMFDGEKIYHWNKKIWTLLTLGNMFFIIWFYLCPL